MDILKINTNRVVTELGASLLVDGRTLVFLCRQLLIQFGGILDSDDVLIVEGARIILRNLPKSGRIDLCPSYMKGHSRVYCNDNQKEYLNNFDFIGVCSYNGEDISVKLLEIPQDGQRWLKL
jgi:hypothetical protein